MQGSPGGSSASTSAGDADSQIVSEDSQDGNSDSPQAGDAKPVKFEEYQFQRLPSSGLLGLTDQPLPMSIGTDLEVTPTDDSKLQWCHHCHFTSLCFFIHIGTQLLNKSTESLEHEKDHHIRTRI